MKMKAKLLQKALLVATLGLSSQLMADTVMRVASWLPPSHVQNTVVLPTWGKWIKEATEGRVTLMIEYGLGHPKSLFEMVEDGVADASWSFHGYVPGRFKLTQVVEQPLLGADAEAASVAHWRVHQKYLAKGNEHDGLVLAALFTHGPGQIHTTDPIHSLDDLKGKKIRLGGGVQGELGHRMHVTSVGAPAPKVYEMMQQGVIDGVFMPLAEQKTLRLKEVAKNVTVLPGGMYLGSFSVFINPDFMDMLDKKDRDAIMAVSGEKLSALAGRVWEAGDAQGLQEAKEAGVNVVQVKASDSMAIEFKKLVQGMEQDWLKSVSSRGVDAETALTELRNIARAYPN